MRVTRQPRRRSNEVLAVRWTMTAKDDDSSGDDGKGDGGKLGQKVTPPQAQARRDRRAKPEAAFDLWLERGLRAMYDGVAQEPVPEALRRLIEADRKK
jgi:hypothetical protein